MSRRRLFAERLDWRRDGRDWPNRAASRFVQASGLTWHVQVMGSGPELLLAHGTGSSTHSWRDLMPLLARHFTVIAPDLPGHGFTDMPAGGLSLPAMANQLAALAAVLQARPAIAIGHSAGAAVLARMCLDGRASPRALVSLNGALLPFGGTSGQLFAPLAKLLVTLPGVPTLFAWRAGDRAVVERLIRDTGSRLDDRGLTLYRRLAGNPVHAAAALSMMAHWDLEPLLRDLPRLQPLLTLVAAERDRAVTPAVAQRVRPLVPGAHIVMQPGLGHLSHEEDPGGTTRIILDAARRAAVDAAPA